MTGAAAPRLPSGYRLAFHESIGSTNEEATRRARAGESGGLVVWALEQTRGRGRRLRPWSTGRGDMALSILERPNIAAARAGQASFVAALALHDALAALLGPDADVRLKWPNDALLTGRKVSGILLEASGRADAPLGWIVVGVGLNLVSHPEGTDYPATDVRAATGIDVKAAEAVTAYVAAFARRWRAWLDDGFGPVRAAWLERAAGLGDQVRVRLDRETATGRFVDIDSLGALVLETAPGLQRSIAAGDVFPLAE
jgi:BirA family transcriptional regulator, biotin operon repressor / biotin---[acetyl-CoA-carboxylase] ligase